MSFVMENSLFETSYFQLAILLARFAEKKSRFRDKLFLLDLLPKCFLKDYDQEIVKVLVISHISCAENNHGCSIPFYTFILSLINCRSTIIMIDNSNATYYDIVAGKY